MTIKQQMITLIPLVIFVAGLLGYNFMSAQWQSPTSTPPNANTPSPLNISANYQAKLGDLGAVRMRAGEYCNADGTVCVTAGGLSGGTWGSWTNVTASRPSATWHQNTSGKGIMVHFYVSRADVVAYVSPTGSNTNQIQITGVDGDSGERTHGNFLVPPGHYYRFNGGTMSMVAELQLPF